MYVQLLAQSCCYLQWFCSFQLNLAVIYHAFATWACIDRAAIRKELVARVGTLAGTSVQAGCSVEVDTEHMPEPDLLLGSPTSSSAGLI